MDKLQPIIKQRFWILLGLCLILALFGFFKSQSEIVAATKTREDAIKATLAAIPSGTEPNPTYAEGLKQINDAYGAKIKAAIDDLFAGQQSRMTWPDKIAKEIPRDPKGVPYYRHKEKVLNTIATRTYSTVYSDLIEELWKKAEPVVEKAAPVNAAPVGIGPNRSAELLRGINSGLLKPRGKQQNLRLKGQTILYGQPGFPPVTWQTKVYVDRQAMPQKVLPSIPSADQVWDCQEDIWFTELLLEAVRKANKEAENVLSSPVRCISRIELLGGAGAGAAPEVDPSMMEGGMGEDGMSMGSGMAMGGVGAAGIAGMLAPPMTAFDPKEVFGSDAAAATGEAGGEAMPEDGSGIGMGMGMMGPPPTLRWVGPTEGVPFRERGFYLSVIINQQKIPDFLVYLCEGAWPTKVLRFQMGPNPYRKDVVPGSGSMAMGGYDPYGGGGGMEAGSAFPGGMGGMMGGMGGFSGESMGMGGMGFGMGAANKWPGGPPAWAGTPKDPFQGALNNSDLVQLDVAGIVTFYVPSETAEATGEAPAVDTPSAPGGDAELLKAAAEEAAAAATPAAPGGTTPATPETPAAAPATTPPATGEQPAAPPANPPAVDGGAPAATPPAGTEPQTPPAAAPPAEPAPAPGT
ncbi:MAG TPA: hypothetical protein VM452_04815 [Caulifigura sp.]|nr:hypothetical protein [Caulifigura sp.]